MKMFKYVLVGISILICFSITGCSNAQKSSTSSKSSASSKDTEVASSLVTEGKIENQLALPEKGEQIAIFHVKNYGIIKCRLFPQVAPKAVQNFIGLAQKGKYNNVPFHRVIEDFMIQSGGNSDSIYGSGFNVELNQSLHHYNGALCAARTNSQTSGQSSQFYIVSSENGKKADFDKISQTVNQQYKQKGSKITLEYTDVVKNTYKQVGGYPGLDMQYTVFGQTFEGQDVVKKIASCPKSSEMSATGEKSAPDPEVILEKVEIVNY